MYSTVKNIIATPPKLSSNTTCARYLRYPDFTGRRKGEGGLRLRGKYKVSLPGKPLVSVITIVFNRVNTIERALQSVFTQTYENIEYIIVDGGSTDGTHELIQRYDNYIDYYLSEPDAGIYNAMNKALELATGDYIAILNSDDWYVEDALEISVAEILKTGADYSGAEEFVIDGNGSILGVYELKHFDEVALFSQNPCNHGTMLISSLAYNTIGKYDETYRIAADFKMQLLLIKHQFRACVVRKPIHYYELAGVSSVNRQKTLKEVHQILKEFHTELSDEEIWAIIDIMHEHRWDERIKSLLENVLAKECYCSSQKSFLENRMRMFGYTKNSQINQIAEVVNDKNRKPSFTHSLRKCIKYMLPYGVIRLYQKLKYDFTAKTPHPLGTRREY